MKKFSKSVFKLELLNFIRTKVAGFGFLILLCTGIMGLYFGKNLINQQQKVIKQTAEIQQETLRNNIKKFGYDLGDFLYSNTFSTVHVPSKWASFANGQRDLHSFVLPVTINALESQMYDTDLTNPISQLLGNLDLSFVFILLFPLIIIVFGYNVWSLEQESGVWQMLRVQSKKSVFFVLMRKLWLRFVVILALTFILLLLSVWYLNVDFDTHLWAVSVVVFCYILFWFAVLGVVVSFNKSSIFNAITLLSVWILFTVFIPAILNVFLSNILPIPEALSTVVQQRESYHEKWDQPKDSTIQKFYKHYPSLKKYPLATDKFTWGWFYAMQQMGDDESTQQSNMLLEKLRKRQEWTHKVALIFPTINAQLQLNQLAQTDLQSHIDFLNGLRSYHEKIRTYFYPIIFRNGTIDEVDFKQLTVYKYEGDTRIENVVWIRLVISLCISILLLAWAYVNFKKRLN